MITRWCVILLTCLALGAAVNIAVALAAKEFARPSVMYAGYLAREDGLSDKRADSHWPVDVFYQGDPQVVLFSEGRPQGRSAVNRPHQAIRFIRDHFRLIDDDNDMLPIEYSRVRYGGGVLISMSSIEQFSRIARITGMKEVDRWFLASLGYGWPARSLCWSVDSESDASAKISTEMLIFFIDTDVPMDPPGRIIDFRDVRILWRGFIENTAFYAAIVFALFMGTRFARTRLRLAHGRCPKCGYDLRGQRQTHDAERPHPLPLSRRERGVEIGCPECGWNRRDQRDAR